MAQKINVDSRPGAIMPTLYFSQDDIGREFLLEVVSSDGFNIPVGATVKCVGTKPSGFGFTVPCTFSGNTVTLVASDDDDKCFTNEPGKFRAELQIEYNGDNIGTANFLMFSEKNPHPSGTIDDKASEVIPQLTQLVDDIEAAAASIHSLTVTAVTLEPGEDATATYDDENNSIEFGIPRGGEVSCSDPDADGNIIITLI